MFALVVVVDLRVFADQRRNRFETPRRYCQRGQCAHTDTIGLQHGADATDGTRGLQALQAVQHSGFADPELLRNTRIVFIAAPSL